VAVTLFGTSLGLAFEGKEAKKEEAKKAAEKKVDAKKETPKADAKKETPKAAEGKKVEKKTAAKKASNESSSGESSEKPTPAKKIEKPAAKDAKKKKSGSSSSSSSEDDAAPKTNDKKRKADAPADEADAPAKKARKEDAPAASSNGSDGNKRVFVGNLPWSIDDEGIRRAFADAGEIVDINWVTDRATGKFKGIGFLEFTTPEQAQAAVKLAGTDVGGRPIKVELAQPKGDRPAAGGAGGFEKKPFAKGTRDPTPKPDGCTTVFLGNLSFDITEDGVREFFGDCGSIKSVRWVERDGQFKGCGFVEFEESAATDAAVAKNGQDVLGRQIRVDFSAPKAPRQW